ncbi:nucleotide exchange factor GrpE, partial [bacterium]|nr:nucleotide exchange factor GrpE [bacterium]
QREKDEFARFAREGFVRDLLPVKDNLERALLHAGDDPQTIVEGVKLTLEQFASTFKAMGVECVECQGKAFDPEFHEAMNQIESDEHEPNTVVGELQKGYQLNGRLLRPAMVTVTKLKPKENE